MPWAAVRVLEGNGDALAVIALMVSLLAIGGGAGPGGKSVSGQVSGRATGQASHARRRRADAGP
jgi:hypothetical protein